VPIELLAYATHLEGFATKPGNETKDPCLQRNESRAEKRKEKIARDY
jgi:hypothetical protein